MKRYGRFCAVVLMLVVFVTARTEVTAQTSANGQFQILSLHPTFNSIVGSNGYVVTWNGLPGRTNYLSYTDSLNAPWQDLVAVFTNHVPPTILVVTDYPPMDATERFYRVRAPRNHVVMSLVLDRSGSMLNDGGYATLAPAVSNFISSFDDGYDYAAQVSYSSAASVDVPMGQPFISNIETAAAALSFGGYTCSDQGLTNALAENNAVTLQPGENVAKVIVFFTDGMANTFNYVFNCGARNIDYNIDLWDPATGNLENSGCTVPPLLSSINPSTGGTTSNEVNTNGCVEMRDEAEDRAERIAYLARSQGITIYCIGLGNPASPGECSGAFPVLDPVFLQNIANTPDSETYDSNQPVGLSVVATNAAQLNALFQTIAQQLLSQ
jgi:hypothetical protein